MKDHATDELNVEVTHSDGALAGLANNGEGLGQDGVEGLLFGGDALLFIFGVSSMPASAAAMRSRNSTVLARSWSSESA